MSECIDHGRAGNNAGYASCWFQGGYSMLHRKAYCLANNVELSTIVGVVVRHSCDNPRCINPEHLLVGTSSDNMRDCVERSRHINNLSNMAHTNRKRGEEQVNSRWSDDDVLEIRMSWASGEKQTSIAKRFGCRQTDVSRIVNRKAWAHI